ncbi:MAG: ABC transporter permease subunit [Anaerolineae bacterium]|nr:ABC transporter permease subunit [Anaerolineae bacterium]
MGAVQRKTLGSALHVGRFLRRGDVLIVIGILVFIYAGIRLASPYAVVGPDVDLNPSSLPWYALLSLVRMTASYLLSLSFTLVFSYLAARNRTAERIMMPILDVLQSVPILSFLPVVLLVLTTIFPSRFGVEVTAVVLIFTSQAWNIAYSFHQSLRTAPSDLQEASQNFRLNWWYRLRYLELPFGMRGLLWNSVVSWANGWFFLMAAETFRVNNRDFRLLGLGSYLQKAADAKDTGAIILGSVVLVAIIVLLDQFVWQPLIAWSERFRVDLVSNDEPARSWFYEWMSKSWLAQGLTTLILTPLSEYLDRRLGGKLQVSAESPNAARNRTIWRVVRILFTVLIIGVLAYGVFRIAGRLLSLPIDKWGQIAGATLASTIRVFAASVLCLVWTLPVGVWIGTNPRLSGILQPIVQSVAAVPATAFFPVLVLYFVSLPAGLDISAVLLMMLGTQWYLLFNVIAGASALPQELKDAARLYKITGWEQWRTLILPALLPYIITGLNIVGGGAWNASIVAEYTEFGSRVYSVPGLGSIIADATARADYDMLLAATLTMIVTVVAINGIVWQRLHHIAEEKYRIE